MQNIEIEHLKACPFCGGRAELKTDKHPMNEAYNRYRVMCQKCQVVGKVFLDGQTLQIGDNPPGFITAEEAAQKAVEAWNRRRMPEIADDIYELTIAAERAAVIADELQQEYFGDAEPDSSTLRANYDRGRVLSNVAFDYAYKTKEIALALEEKI